MTGGTPEGWRIEAVREPGHAERVLATATAIGFLVLGLVGVVAVCWELVRAQRGPVTVAVATISESEPPRLPVSAELHLLTLLALIYAIPVAATCLVVWTLSRATRQGPRGMAVVALLAAQLTLSVWVVAGYPGRGEDGDLWSPLRLALADSAVPVTQALLAVLVLLFVRANRRVGEPSETG